MGDRTAISYTDASWNTFRGCTRVSPGCEHCYAESMAARFCGPGLPFEGTINRDSTVSPWGDKPRWSGRIIEAPEKVWTQPLRWKRPRRIFVNSMSDTFHPAVTHSQLARLFAIMSQCLRHQFLVLTKRPDRMRGYMKHMAAMIPPAANVWIGTTIEDQKRADERIPILQDTPASVRWLSIEPQLDHIDLRGKLDGIHWVVCGGESGPNARAFNPSWPADIIRVCKAAGVAMFMKQMGSNPLSFTGSLKHPKGGDPSEWHERFRVQEFPEVTR